MRMKNLKFISLLLVGDEDTSLYFQKYFREVILVKNNSEALAICQKKSYPVVFLNDEINTVKKIKEYNSKIIIVIVAKNISKKSLMEVVYLHLEGCIEMPFKTNQVQKLLDNIDRKLLLPSSIYNDVVEIKGGYTFCSIEEKLYNEFRQEVKLTKKERAFLKLLTSAKELVSIETIEYTIWEEESMRKDCEGRLKALLHGIRKKLPKESIVNDYGLGYRIISL